MSRKRRRDVSPGPERDASSAVSSRWRLSLDRILQDSDYGAISKRHKDAFDKRSLSNFVNQLRVRHATASVQAREGSQKVNTATRDRRFWHPKKEFLGATFSGREATVFGGRELENLSSLGSVICDQRRERREVLFARGKGGRAHRTPHRWTEHSNRKCV